MPTKLVDTFAEREALEAVRADLATVISGTVKAGFKVQRKDVLGVITASGLLRRRSRTTATGTGFATNSTIGQVADAGVFAPGDVLKTDAGVTIGTVLTVDTTLTPNAVTLTANAAVAVASAAFVVGSDGSQVATSISDQTTDGTGDTTISIFIGGFLKEAGLRGLDASAKTELGGVSTVGGIFKF